MMAHADLQVWLETVPGTHPAIVIPYVESPRDDTLHYQLTILKHGPDGSSRIGQSGDVTTRAARPAALSRFSLNVGAHDECRIELTLLANRQPAGTYRFDCPR